MTGALPVSTGQPHVIFVSDCDLDVIGVRHQSRSANGHVDIVKRLWVLFTPALKLGCPIKVSFGDLAGAWVAAGAGAAACGALAAVVTGAPAFVGALARKFTMCRSVGKSSSVRPSVGVTSKYSWSSPNI